METYAPVVSFSIAWVFLYKALTRNMSGAQIDSETEFLNGALEEDIWVTSPSGILNRPPKVYKLLKAIYGLKQAPLMWHRRLCKDLQALGFSELPSAACVFKKCFASGGVMFLFVYVDDILLLGTSAKEIKSVINGLMRLYDIRHSSSVKGFLGVPIQREHDDESRLKSVKLSQPLYVSDILRRFGMDGSCAVSTPMASTFWTGLEKEENKSVLDVTCFQQIIGSLLYLALRTPLDILTPVMILARFQTVPTSYCFQAVKRILWYLRGTMTHGLE